MQMETPTKKSERRHIVATGEVTNHPEKRNVGRGESKTSMVADLVLAAKQVTVDGVPLAPQEVDSQKWFKVPVWGGEARDAHDKYRAGTVITVEGQWEVRKWESRSGEPRVDHVIQDAAIRIDKESTRGVKVNLVGIVARDPRLEETPNRKPFIRLKLEGVESPGGGHVPEVVTALGWENQAEAIEESFRAGDKVAVVGESVARHWTGRDGESRTTFEIHRPEITLLEKGRSRTADDKGNVGMKLAPDRRVGSPEQRDRPVEKPAPAKPVKESGLGSAFAKLFGRGNKAAEQERSR
jgi:single-stranded DNA-binding protein